MDLNIDATIKKITWINMLGSIPHQKFYFNHLPTRGRAGIKLGMLDTSPTYLYFLIVPCYYIICFGCLIGIYMLFYIIFGTNLLTEGPMPVSVFFACFRVSHKRNTKRSPNGMKILRWSFLEQKQNRRLGDEVGDATRKPWGRRAHPPPSWAPRSSTDVLLSPIYTLIP